MRTLKEYNLTFTEMYTTKPYIFISARHPLGRSGSDPDGGSGTLSVYLF